MELIIKFFTPLFCFIYPWMHNFFRYIVEKLFQNKNKRILSIRIINILYFPVFVIVFYHFTFGDFSIFFGWESIKNGEPEQGRLIGFILLLILPFFIFLSSITYGFICATRIKNPEKVLDEEYD